MTSGDVNAVIKLYSRQSGVLSIGTDLDEWWDGYNPIEQAVRAQLQEIGKKKMNAGSLKAFVEGDVGWVADRPKTHLPDGEEITLRWTNLFRREGGEWKTVQRHVSIGVSNEETTGKELPARKRSPT